MRIGALILAIWLIVGIIAAAQRHYLGGGANCTHVGTVVVTVVAGPLNYVGVNPKVSCTAPRPS